jgi:hypothetical protein
MSSTYAGDPTNYPTDITIPDDGDARDAASVNAAFEGLADRTAWLEVQASGALDFYATSCTSTAPRLEYQNNIEQFTASVIGTTATLSTQADHALAVTLCEVGDVLEITAQVVLNTDFWPAAGGDEVFVYLAVVDSGGANYVPGGFVSRREDGDVIGFGVETVTVSGRYTVDTAGTNTVKLGVQFDSNAANWVARLGSCNITVRRHRPPA